jgi:hypothetical protein
MHLLIVMDRRATLATSSSDRTPSSHVAERHRLDSGGPFVLSRPATPRAPRGRGASAQAVRRRRG